VITAASSCDLCGASIAAGHEHAHVLDVQVHAILCACTACAEHASGRMRLVPDRWLNAGRLDAWDHLEPPVEAAFFQCAGGRWTAYYPGPKGAMGVPLRAADGAALARCSLAAFVEEEVEALLARRAECFLVPVRACYELAGRLRRSWRGREGGDEVRREIDQFFARVRARCPS
jgi:hypothetical protein